MAVSVVEQRIHEARHGLNPHDHMNFSMHAYLRMCVCTRTYLHMSVCVIIHVPIYACMHACMHACVRVCMLACMLRTRDAGPPSSARSPLPDTPLRASPPAPGTWPARQDLGPARPGQDAGCGSGGRGFRRAAPANRCRAMQHYHVTITVTNQ